MSVHRVTFSPEEAGDAAVLGVTFGFSAVFGEEYRLPFKLDCEAFVIRKGILLQHVEHYESIIFILIFHTQIRCYQQY